jgi:dTDP-4-amino-4,6-dideoxy-D-galactose acyltransferase
MNFEPHSIPQSAACGSSGAPPPLSMPTNAPCEFLEWDSAFFGCRIARAIGGRLDDVTAQNIAEWCASQAIDCIYLLASSDDDDTVRAAEHAGFHLVDIRLTFECRLTEKRAEESNTTEPLVRALARDDIPVLRQLAAGAYSTTRFHYDRHFRPERATELYQTWIEKSCNGYADEVLVAELRREPVGFLSCHLDSAAAGQIGLVGVREDVHGTGVGRALVGACLAWFQTRKVERVRVVTQGRNIGAQRLYQRHGFQTHAVQLWYHRWL